MLTRGALGIFQLEDNEGTSFSYKKRNASTPGSNSEVRSEGLGDTYVRSVAITP